MPGRQLDSPRSRPLLKSKGFDNVGLLALPLPSLLAFDGQAVGASLHPHPTVQSNPIPPIRAVQSSPVPVLVYSYQVSDDLKNAAIIDICTYLHTVTTTTSSSTDDDWDAISSRSCKQETTSEAWKDP
ncbi:hypothetical protein K431DRAFT_306684 [Polychaeton citri CBS 116435]|uniref:Uncharacterized protein n=1 Tax=Polychaeton citri CBS 116435 TaxID=1314669 RepID=A0A9P4Q1B6_9PEZI|nr:hypothetical protein K431DRAFT_306684 [Polychaeton citri CBS 116435]